ncbi:MAG: hypothetical protein ABH884_01225 [Candidatus Komeilibacteria bacterium]
MLETSKDLLNIVIAFCVLWLTVFICWFIYYIVSIMRRVTETMDQVSKMTVNINNFFTEAKNKMQQATSYIPMVFEGIKGLTNYVNKKSKTKTASKSKKTK